MSGKKSDDEWLKLREEVRLFLNSNASEKDKKMLMEYTETLSMMCAAIEDGT